MCHGCMERADIYQRVVQNLDDWPKEKLVKACRVRARGAMKYGYAESSDWWSRLADVWERTASARSLEEQFPTDPYGNRWLTEEELVERKRYWQERFFEDWAARQ